MAAKLNFKDEPHYDDYVEEMKLELDVAVKGELDWRMDWSVIDAKGMWQKSFEENKAYFEELILKRS